MAIVILTTAQKNAIKNNSDFQAQLRSAIIEEARYTSTLQGTGVAANDTALADWAKKRLLSYSIIQYPNSALVFSDWLEQAIALMIGMQVYDDSEAYSEANVITYMIANSKFLELAGLVFLLRMKEVKF